MTVEPGYYGQSFLANGLEKIGKLAALRSSLAARYHGHHIMIEVDGGISDKNINEVKKAGAEMVVAGSFVFKAENPNERVSLLKT